MTTNETIQYDCSRGCVVTHEEQTGETRCTYRAGCCKLGDYNWLKDAGGRYWYAESGVNLLSEKGIYDRVRRQLHSAVPPSVKELVSEDVREELGLEVMP